MVQYVSMRRRLKYILATCVVIMLAFAISFSTKVNDKTNNTKTDIGAIGCPNCNVIIVGYDTVAASHVSSLGYGRNTTPELDKFASEGVSFANNIAPAPWTVPSFMSIHTGLYPTQHKIVNKYTVYNNDQQTISNLSVLSPKVETLAQQFKNNGYITGGFTGDSGVSAKFGYSNGFDVYTDETAFGSIGNSADKAIDWLKKNPNKKFFMFLHGYDSHGQFKIDDAYPKTGEFVPRDYNGTLTGSNAEEADLREKQLTEKLNLSPADVEFLNGIYDSKIKDGDARFASFWKNIQEMGLEKDTVVIVVSDHGEEWYEHGGVDHGHTLYNELVHVPLVFKVPGMKSRKAITQQVTTLDIAPTILEIVGIKPSDSYKSQFQGKSLVPLMQGADAPGQDVFLETDYLDFTHKRGILTANGWKYIVTEQTGVEELYDLSNDPKEQKKPH